MITLDPNQTNDQPVQDQMGVTAPAPIISEPQAPVSEPTAEPVVPAEPSVPPVPAEPVAVPEPTPIESGPTTDGGNMDGDTTPPIPGV